MAAALEIIQLVQQRGTQEHVLRLGQLLIDGLRLLVAKLGVPAEAYGEPLPPMPFLRFTHPDAQTNARLGRAFFREILARGVLLHPRHMWFISGAHTALDIEQTLDAAHIALGRAREKLVGVPG